jgi:hypothetical protein
VSDEGGSGKEVVVLVLGAGGMVAVETLPVESIVVGHAGCSILPDKIVGPVVNDKSIS